MQFKTELLDHQRKAVDKLKKLKVGALFMEMGTGKTRTTLELINIRLNKERINHVIWLCPCSVKENLRRDIIKHTGEDQHELITICGIQTLSSSYKKYTYLMNMVMNYECYLIVDESSLVKNISAIRTKRIIDLSNICKYKLILNGTPVTRNEVDLFSQMYILDWRILGYKSMWSFAANHIEYDEYGKLRRCLNVDYLVEKIGPYSYQVNKSDCCELPEKTYETIYYSLTKEQNEHYNEVADIFLSNVDEFEQTTIYRLFTALQLVLSGKKIIAHTRKESYINPLTQEIEVVETIDSVSKEKIFKNIYDNPRIQILLEIIKGINQKCIIFAKSTEEIKDIVKVINENGKKAISYYGELNLKKRQDNINKFSEDVQFLVANKVCAGYGLNLQFCSYVIFYSNDFDFGTRSQAEDRVHRIGQENNVHIIDICADNKFEERILKCLNNKENLLESIKAEIDKNGNVKEAFESWLYVRNNYNGKRKMKRKKAIDKSDLIIKE